MKRVCLTVAYDGTAYHGWALQPGVTTIEGELNKALSDLLGEEIQVIGASRTDSGVHARCNIAVFDTKTRIPGEKISYALNQRLPNDIRIQKSVEVDPDFHPRHCESVKTYEYSIYHATFPMPDRRLYTHFVYGGLELWKMQQAGAYLVGEHDFKSFCSTGSSAETTVRTIHSLEVISREISAQEEIVVIRVSGNGFLYNMVRIIAGTLLEIGQGKREPESILEILDATDRQAAGPTLPPNGLMLVKYEFL